MASFFIPDELKSPSFNDMRTRTKTKDFFAPRATGLGRAWMRAAVLLILLTMTSVTAWAQYETYVLGYIKAKTIRCPNGHDDLDLQRIHGLNCKGDGYVILRCRVCLEGLSVSIPAPGHDWRFDSFLNPTCTERGGVLLICNYCGEKKYENEQLPLGHAWDEYNICTRCNTPNGDITLADGADNGGKIARLASLGSITLTLQGRTLYADGDWNTLCLPFALPVLTGTPLEGFTVKELDTETSYDGHKTGLEDETLYLNFKDATSIEAGKPYIVKWNLTPALTISSDADWTTFAENVNSGTEDYANKTVQLGADISVTTMVGTADHPFSGTFDGQGHTLSVSISDTGIQGAAPFRYISNASIGNVKVTGTVTGNLHCAGLVGFANGTNDICQCEVAASVTCSGGSHSHCGGILGHGMSSATTITDCLFSGTISGATTATGIIYGWGDNGTHRIVNCLADGTYTDCNGIELLRKNEGTEVITNCYKTQNTGSQGTYTTATGSELAALLGSNWQQSGDKAVPKMNAALDNIMNPKFEGVTIDATAPQSVTSSDGKVSFTGYYSPISLEAEDHSVLFLGAACTLYWPSEAMNINPFRAYFKLGGSASVSAYRLGFGNGSATAVEQPFMDNGEGEMENEAGTWYDLAGRRLADEPAAPGFYIRNGRKVVVK